MTPADLQVALRDLVASAATARGADVSLTDAELVLERPRTREHGDWASTVAMRVGKRIGVAPRDLAAEIAAGLQALDGVAAVDVAGPGFINITLEAASAGELARRIVAEGEAFGRGTALDRAADEPRVRLREPHRARAPRRHPLGRGRRQPRPHPRRRRAPRWPASTTSTTTARRSTASRGSLLAAHLGEPTPEDGYGGDYIGEIAARVAAAHPGGRLPAARRAAQEVFRREGVDLMFGEIQAIAARLRRRLRRLLPRELALRVAAPSSTRCERLRELGHIYEADGATWLRTTEFGDDRDRVVLKSNGEAAYIAGDIAYYLEQARARLRAAA